MSGRSELVFYTTAGCHLCAEAELMLAALQAAGRLTFRAVDIADQDGLLERYGLTIPVVRNPLTGTEICWPFGDDDIVGLVAGGVEPEAEVSESDP